VVPVFSVELVKLIDEILALQANQHEGMSNDGGSMGTQRCQTKYDSNQNPWDSPLDAGRCISLP